MNDDNGIIGLIAGVVLLAISGVLVVGALVVGAITLVVNIVIAIFKYFGYYEGEKNDNGNRKNRPRKENCEEDYGIEREIGENWL